MNAGNEDTATVLGYNTLGDTQTEPCPFPSGFGGKEGIKDGIQGVFRYPAAEIYHFHRQITGFIGRDHQDLDFPSFGGGIHRIEEEVQEGLPELLPVTVDAGQVSPALQLDLDA